MRTIHLTVNGKAVVAAAEPRTHLADFLREQQLLTGTHLGCEHGVCGACTLLIDGAPARSCITYAVACEGAEITTIEGLDDDEITHELRAAFSREHGLQCGYCTPGMLVTARDIVTRLPDADERRVRFELSGNLCRCTGYVGIVRAVCAVLDQRRRNSLTTEPMRRGDALGPVGAGRAAPTMPENDAGAATVAPAAVASPSDRAPGPVAGTAVASEQPRTVLRQSFTVDHPRERVFAFFTRHDEVVACMPGAALTEAAHDGCLRGRLRIKLGPIAADFAGEAEVEHGPGHRGVIRGRGRDSRTGSATEGEVSYVLIEEKAGAATRVDIEVGYTLTGALAQFSRPGIVNDVAARLTADFARNVEARLAGTNASSAATAPAELDAGSLIVSVIRTRIRRLFDRLRGR